MPLRVHGSCVDGVGHVPHVWRRASAGSISSRVMGVRMLAIGRIDAV